MGIKLKPDITINIARTIFFNRYLNGGINIHHRDAKRILQRKVWNSRKINYDGDSFVSVMIVQSMDGLMMILWIGYYNLRI